MRSTPGAGDGRTLSVEYPNRPVRWESFLLLAAGRYAARLEAKIAPNTDPGEYRCVRLSAHDRLDDDWDFSEIGKLDLVVRVERAPRRLEVTKSEFLRDGCKK